MVMPSIPVSKRLPESIRARIIKVLRCVRERNLLTFHDGRRGHVVQE